MSDASLVKRRRGRGKSAAQREKERQHRFSINGHFYNYKVDFCRGLFLCTSPLPPLISRLSLRSPQTSIFTPSFGTPTKVRISSRMTTDQVIEQLLNKFKVHSLQADLLSDTDTNPDVSPLLTRVAADLTSTHTSLCTEGWMLLINRESMFLSKTSKV